MKDLKKTSTILGISLFVLTLVLIFINDVVENDFLRKTSEYGRYFAIMGGALIGWGIFSKRKN